MGSQGSLPPWERGLKLVKSLKLGMSTLVAPPVGAWIETIFPTGWELLYPVAPPVGAWIETMMILSDMPQTKSRSPRGSVD